MNFEIHTFVCLAGGGGITSTAPWILVQTVKQQSVIIIVLKKNVCILLSPEDSSGSIASLKRKEDLYIMNMHDEGSRLILVIGKH
jgi:hypothetical protein